MGSGSSRSYADIDFLTESDDVKVIDWLIYKTTNEKPDAYRQRQLIKEMLHKLAGIYAEDERMIANRTVQTAEMLREHGLDFSLPDFLRSFITIPAEGSMTVFGSYCQHYYYLRMSNLSHTQAIEYMVSEHSQSIRKE